MQESNSTRQLKINKEEKIITRCIIVKDPSEFDIFDKDISPSPIYEYGAFGRVNDMPSIQCKGDHTEKAAKERLNCGYNHMIFGYVNALIYDLKGWNIDGPKKAKERLIRNIRQPIPYCRERSEAEVALIFEQLSKLAQDNSFNSTEKKEHPCMVEYWELSKKLKIEDELFQRIVELFYINKKHINHLDSKNTGGK